MLPLPSGLHTAEISKRVWCALWERATLKYIYSGSRHKLIWIYKIALSDIRSGWLNGLSVGLKIECPNLVEVQIPSCTKLFLYLLITHLCHKLTSSKSGCFRHSKISMKIMKCYTVCLKDKGMGKGK